MSDPRLRELPSVRAFLDRAELASWIVANGRETVTVAIRSVVDETRKALLQGHSEDSSVGHLLQAIVQKLSTSRPSLRRVINATGILLHTGLGRAPLAAEAAEAVDRVIRGYCNLELDLESGARGSRTSSVAKLLCELTGAEAATVVNNNAAATILALKATAAGREVIVSRGELIEIGGSFRLPEICEVSGAFLREVGTTNKTRLSDYERAIGPETAAILRVHPSNYRIVGFTESTTIAEIAGLAKQRGILAIDDIGSGALSDGIPPGIIGEPTVAQALRAGADLILFSGDKLLGGPQCGVILGTKAAIKTLTTDPLMRAFRVDKMTLAALEATLLLALDPNHAQTRIPLWRFLTTPVSQLRQRAEVVAEAIRISLGQDASVIETASYSGGGSSPDEPLVSAAVRIKCAAIPAESVSKDLRIGDPSIVARIYGGDLILDFRAIDASEDEALLKGLAACFASRNLPGSGLEKRP